MSKLPKNQSNSTATNGTVESNVKNANNQAVSRVISYRQAVKQGNLFVCSEYPKKIMGPKVDSLIRDLNRKHKTKFEKPGQVIPADKFLREHPDLFVSDIERINVEFLDCSERGWGCSFYGHDALDPYYADAFQNYDFSQGYVILNGTARALACLIDPSFDMDFEILDDCSDVYKTMQALNDTEDRDWQTGEPLLIVKCTYRRKPNLFKKVDSIFLILEAQLQPQSSPFSILAFYESIKVHKPIKEGHMLAVYESANGELRGVRLDNNGKPIQCNGEFGIELHWSGHCVPELDYEAYPKLTRKLEHILRRIRKRQLRQMVRPSKQGRPNRRLRRRIVRRKERGGIFGSYGYKRFRRKQAKQKRRLWEMINQLCKPEMIN